MDVKEFNAKQQGKVINEEKKQKILDSAKQVFSEKGYHKSTIGEIAARAGVAHGTIYTYFPNKHALATELLGTWGASGFLESLPSLGGKQHSPEEFLQIIADKFIGDLDERAPLIRFRISEAMVNEELGPEYFRRLIHRFILNVAKYCERCQKDGIFKEGDPYIQAHAFYAVIHALVYTQELLRGKKVYELNLDEAVKASIALYINGVKKS
ncbi:MAG: TetR/AcrR family transcriptional regulator [Pseudomonadota bacterium]